MPTIREQLDAFSFPVGHVWIKDFLGAAETPAWNGATVYYFSQVDPDKYDPDSISIEWDNFDPIAPSLRVNLDTRECQWHSCDVTSPTGDETMTELLEFHMHNLTAWLYIHNRLVFFWASHGASDV